MIIIINNIIDGVCYFVNGEAPRQQYDVVSF